MFPLDNIFGWDGLKDLPNVKHGAIIAPGKVGADISQPPTIGDNVELDDGYSVRLAQPMRNSEEDKPVEKK